MKAGQQGARPKEGKRKGCVQHLPGPGVIASSMSTCLSAMCEPCWISSGVLGQIHTRAPHETLCRLARTERAGQSPGTGSADTEARRDGLERNDIRDLKSYREITGSVTDHIPTKEQKGHVFAF